MKKALYINCFFTICLLQVYFCPGQNKKTDCEKMKLHGKVKYVCSKFIRPGWGMEGYTYTYCRFNEAGQKIEEGGFGADDVATHKAYYSYDRKGRLSKITSLGFSDKLNDNWEWPGGVTSFLYDSNDHVIEKRMVGGRLSGTVKYAYNEKGDTLSVAYYTLTMADTMREEWRYEYEYKDGWAVIKGKYGNSNEMGNHLLRYTLNDNGDLMKEEFDAEGFADDAGITHRTFTIQFKYDNKGNMLEGDQDIRNGIVMRYSYDADGGLVSEGWGSGDQGETYKCDSNHNWIASYYKCSGGEICQVWRREIVYYDEKKAIK